MFANKVIALILVIYCCVECQDLVPPTVDELDITKYIGRWYEMYSSPIPKATYEANGTCGTASYAIANSTAILVYNSQRLYTPDGPEDSLDGVAVTTDDPGKLLLYLSGVEPGNYWVMELGPETQYGDELFYSYSLVTNPTKSVLFVLARDVEEFELKYEIDVLRRIDELGFSEDGLIPNQPIPVYQGSDCLYPPEPSPFENIS